MSGAAASEVRRGHAALVAVQVCFGLFPLFGMWTFAEGGFEPEGVAFWRMVFGAAVLGTIVLVKYGAKAWPGWRELPLLFLLSLLGVTLNQVLYLNGLARSTVSNAGLLMCLIPVFTFVIAGLFRQERFRWLRAVGVTLSLGGAAFWWARERPELVSQYSLGNLLMAVNTLAYSLFLVLSRPLVQRRPPLVVIAWVFAFAALCSPLLAIGTDIWPSAASPRVWWSLAYVLIFPTVVGYFLNTYALERLRASTTAIYIYVQPLIAAAAGAIVLGEELTPAFLGAGAMIFAGIWLVSRPPPS